MESTEPLPAGVGSFIPGLPTSHAGHTQNVDVRPTSNDGFVVFMPMSYCGKVYDVPVVVDEETLNEIMRRKMSPPPASKEAVESLPKQILTQESQLFAQLSGGENQCGNEAQAYHTCTVCLDGLCEGQEATRMPCGHIFHSECLDQWLHRHNTCPLCRSKIQADPLIQKQLSGEDASEEDELRFAIPLTETDLQRMARCMSVRHLKQTIMCAGARCDDCVEKTDLLLRFLEVVTTQRRRSRQSSASAGN